MDAAPDAIQSGGAAGRRLVTGDRDTLIREEPLLLAIERDQLLTMRTPGGDLDLAAGFLLSEGLIDGIARIESMTFQKGIPLDEPGVGAEGEGTVPDRVVVKLAGGTGALLQREVLRRTHEIRPSCGVCGVESLSALLPGGEAFAPATPELSAKALAQLLDAFRARQQLFAATGACHAAALASATGEILGFGEDVGRHNALDKAIGAAARAGHATAGTIGLLSGRAGYELVAKLLRIGAPIIVAISAPSALAFDLCHDAGATLVGFARGGTFKVYADQGRIVAP